MQNSSYVYNRLYSIFIALKRHLCVCVCVCVCVRVYNKILITVASRLLLLFILYGFNLN